MKVLVVGTGAREHAIADALKDDVELYCYMSKINPGMSRIAEFRQGDEGEVEKVAKYYTPVMMVAAICVALIPPLLFGQNLTDWVYKALSLLVISCPCAFLISTPVGMVSSITSATRNGVIIKGSTYVEEMRNVKAVIFDMTESLAAVVTLISR